MGVYAALTLSALASGYGAYSSIQGAKQNASSKEDYLSQAKDSIDDYVIDAESGLKTFTKKQKGKLKQAYGVQKNLLNLSNDKSLDIINGIKSRTDQLYPSFNEISDPLAYIDRAKTLSTDIFNFENDLKKKQLISSVGQEGYNNLSSARDSFSRLAAGNTKDFQRELKASSYASLADSNGDAIGTFANVSAKNLLDFKTLGTDAALKISDYFYTRGTADPVNPIKTSFDLANFAVNERDNAINFQLNKLNASNKVDELSLNLNQTYYSNKANAASNYANQMLALQTSSYQAAIALKEQRLNATLNLGGQQAELAGVGATARGAAFSGYGQSLSTLASGISDFQNNNLKSDQVDDYVGSIAKSQDFYKSQPTYNSIAKSAPISSYTNKPMENSYASVNDTPSSGVGSADSGGLILPSESAGSLPSSSLFPSNSYQTNTSNLLSTDFSVLSYLKDKTKPGQSIFTKT